MTSNIASCNKQHFYLAGSTETKWKHYARVQKIVKVLGKSSLMHNNTIGGRFRLQFAANNTKGISKGEFLAEAGPLQYHVGYLLTYYVDRILGVSLLSFYCQRYRYRDCLEYS